MKSDDLSPAQCRALLKQLAPMLGYLNKLRHRMQIKGFPLEDPLSELVSRAQVTIQSLVTEIRCQSGRVKSVVSGTSSA